MWPSLIKAGVGLAPKFKSTIGHMGAGAGAGGLLGGVGSLFDDDDDFISDIGVGAGMGALGGGAWKLGGMASGKLSKPGRWLGAATGLGALGAGLGHALGADFGSEGPVSGVDNAVAAATGSGSPMGPMASGGLPDWLTSGIDMGEPNVETKSLTDWMADPELNRIANAQIIAGNAAIMREQKDLRTNMQRDLQANEALGDEYQIQAAAIGRDNAADTRSIINAADANQQRIDADTDAMHEATGAALEGNDVTRREHAAQMDSQDARLNEARISDQELLERLGVSGQEVLGEIAAAEAAQTRDNAVKIRTGAMDKITENRSEAKDAWRYEKPTIMGTLAQGAMDREVQQRQLGLQGYQMKMQQAQHMKDKQQEYIQHQQGLQADTMGAGPNAAMLNAAATGSGIKVMGPGGQPIELPVWINSPEMAQQRGIDEATFNMWQKLIQTPEIAEQLGMVQ